MRKTTSPMISEKPVFRQGFLKGLFLSVALFSLFTASVQSFAFDLFRNLQTLQGQGDMNSPAPWLENEEQGKILLDLREGIPDAIAIYEGTILPMAKMFWGAENYRIARGLNFLAQLYSTIGDYENAERVFLEAVRIMAKRYPRHYDTAAIYNNLGLLYTIIGDYPKAKNYYDKAVTLAENLKELGPNHPYTFTGRINLAGVYLALNDYAKTEQLYQEAFQIVNSLTDSEETLFDTMRNRFLGEFDGHRKILFYQNMAQFYGSILGDYDQAERHYQTALTLINQAVSSPHFIKGAIHQGLGWVYLKQGNYKKAKRYSETAVAIYQKLPDWRHSKFSTISLLQLGYIYQLQDKDTDAEKLLKRAENISQQIPEPKKTNIVGITNHHLAMFYHETGQLDNAAAYFQKALNIFESRLGRDHPMTVILMQRFAALQFDQGKTNQAVAMALEAQPLSEKVLKKILSFGSEAQRLAYQKRAFPYDLLARVANQTGNAKPLANAILRNKGVILDSLIEDYQLDDKSIKDIKSLKWQLMKLPMGKKAERERLEFKLKRLQSSLAQKVGEARQAFKLKFQDVQNALPDNSVLIEFIRYWHWVGMQPRDAYYGAVIIPKQGDPIWAALGNADSIEQNILKYQTEMACKGESCQLDDETLTHLLKTLYQQVWTPIENRLPNGTQAAILSPDGELNFLSFATLLNPQKKEGQYLDDFLGQQIDLYYVASGRDLLRQSQSTADGKTMAIYALTDWKTPPSQKQALVSVKQSLDRQVDMNLELNKLTGTKKEAEVLKSLVQSNDWTVEMLLNSDAAENRLHQLSSPPRILHFATHAMFLDVNRVTNPTTPFNLHFDLTANGVEQSPPLELLSNPMRRSFLALAGAQNTIEAWRKQGSPSSPPENDGILTAEEVSLLDLADTWITTMSACDTGRGEGRVGEGVLGLRRGFVQSGTQNLLMTLWPIKDDVEEIRNFLREFYQRALETKNAPKALNDVQRQWMVKVMKTDEGANIDDGTPLFDAVRLIGPFVMSFQGAFPSSKKNEN